MIDILKVIVLSLVEGFTEFLPISSTGHMIIVDRFISLSNNQNFTNSFQIIIQLGAILSVLIYFFDKINIFTKDYKKKIIFFSKVILAVIPSAVVGILFDDFIELKFFNIHTVIFTLIFYGIILYVVEKYLKNKEPKYNDLYSLPLKICIFIGIFQILALIPGTSRSASTIIGGLLLGVNRVISTEFSFFLAIPTMVGATLLKIIKIGFTLTHYEIFLISLGFIFSFIFSFVFISYLMKYIKKYNFKIFAYYRIFLGLFLIILMFLGVI